MKISQWFFKKSRSKRRREPCSRIFWLSHGVSIQAVVLHFPVRHCVQSDADLSKIVVTRAKSSEAQSCGSSASVEEEVRR